MAIYMYIPDIAGDVTAKDHEQWIELTNFNFHVKRQITAHAGRISDREVTRPYISELHLAKHADRSSPQLLREACVGKAIDSIKVHMCLTNERLDPYQEFTFGNVLVSYLELTADTNSKTEMLVNLSFDRLEYKYIPFDSKHRPESPIATGYDLSRAISL